VGREGPHYLGHRKRLRERFTKGGRQALRDDEILELLLGYAIPRKDTKPIAKALVARFGTLRKVIDAPLEDLEGIEGISEYAGVLVRLVRECMSRGLVPDRAEAAEALDNPEAVIRYLRAEIGGEKTEHFMLLCLNPAGRLIGTEHLSKGTVDMAHVYPREVFKTALAKGASALILVHNHPSGSITPSAHDEKLTRLLTEIGQGLGIAVHDHLIVTRDRAYSIRLGRLITGEAGS
jgi:DNA repair protein RadC